MSRMTVASPHASYLCLGLKTLDWNLPVSFKKSKKNKNKVISHPSQWMERIKRNSRQAVDLGKLLTFLIKRKCFSTELVDVLQSESWMLRLRHKYCDWFCSKENCRLFRVMEKIGDKWVINVREQRNYLRWVKS